MMMTRPRIRLLAPLIIGLVAACSQAGPRVEGTEAAQVQRVELLRPRTIQRVERLSPESTQRVERIVPNAIQRVEPPPPPPTGVSGVAQRTAGFVGKALLVTATAGLAVASMIWPLFI
jgi:hypothetical protein